MEIQHCVRCGSGLRAPLGITQTGDPAVAIFLMCQTVGIRPRIKTPAQRRVFCAPCAVAIAFGPAPDNGAFNSAIYSMLVSLVSAGENVMEVAWHQKMNPSGRRKLMPGSRPDVTLAVPLLPDASDPARTGKGSVM